MKVADKNNDLIHGFFENHLIFRHAKQNKALFEQLISSVSLNKVLKSCSLYHNGESSTDIYVVQDGEIHILRQIEISALEDIKENKIIDIHYCGDLFGEVSLLSGSVHTSQAIASLDSNVFTIPGQFLSSF